MMKSIKDVRRHGQFIPKNPTKYVGRYPIVVRSSWERSMCQWLDKNLNVVEWSSESIFINYFDPVKNKPRRYFPDFYVLMQGKDKKLKKFVVEVKPHKETKPPNNRGNKSAKTKMYESRTYSTNQAKWNAARMWCDKMGMIFLILTEKEMFGK